MNLQIKYWGVGQSVLEWLPIEAAVRRMPHPDVGSNVDVVRRRSVDRQGIVLDVEQARRACPAAYTPLCPVEVPDSPAVAHPAESDIDGTAAGVVPIKGNIRDQAGKSAWSGRRIEDPCNCPANPSPIRTERLTA